MDFVISPEIERKLKHKHEVSFDEVQECFFNRRGGLLEDTREEHKTDPPTQWFISETNKRRKLKVIFILRNDEVVIKSAFDADKVSIEIYKKFAFG